MPFVLTTFVLATVSSLVVLAMIKDGSLCYSCSYSTETEGNRRECIERPEELGDASHFKCNSTSYCVLQEFYDLKQEKVTSYFRTCSGNSWGNECTKDWDHLVCKASCQGDYCNVYDRGNRAREYLAKHRDHSNNDFNTASKGDFSCITFILFCCFVLHIL